ncbi:MAG: hypothetical protein K8R31_10935 [Bacteroidales bacterium]|nr:hypothetical protein [Bacteroidales bacterium]
MKKHRFKLKRTLLIGMLVALTVFLITCDLEQEVLTSENEQEESINNSNICDEILELNYVIETSTRYISKNKKLSDMDIAMMTPKNDKEEINVKLHENGQISMNIKRLTPEVAIKIPHKIRSDNSNELYETVIENNIASFYSESGELLNTVSMELPDYSETVNRLIEITDNCHTQEDITQVVAQLQSNQINNLDKYITDAKNNGIQVVEEDERFIVLRMPLGMIDPGSTNEAVILIDKKLKRLGGTRVYNVEGDLLSTTLFGYGHPKKPFLTAIKQQVKETLPSGAEVTVESLSKIDNINFRLNL